MGGIRSTSIKYSEWALGMSFEFVQTGVTIRIIIGTSLFVIIFISRTGVTNCIISGTLPILISRTGMLNGNGDLNLFLKPSC
jgi:hypothetical protein